MFVLQAFLLFLTLLVFAWFRFRNPAWPEGTPPLIKESQGFFGPARFFTARYDFYQEWSKRFRHFSFHIGNNRIISLSGEAARKWIVECSQLSLVDGYTLLVGAQSAQHIRGLPYDTVILPRFRKLFRGENLKKRLPYMVEEMQQFIQDMIRNQNYQLNAFVDIYRMLYLLTTQVVGAREIIRNPTLASQMQRQFFVLQQDFSWIELMMPWFPAPKLVWRLWNGIQIYRTLCSIILKRRQDGRKEDDSVQMFIDDDDPIAAICRVVMDSTVASAHNTAVMIPWLHVYLGTHKDWACKLRKEVFNALDSCCPDSQGGESRSLLDRFSTLTYQDWETKFPLHDLAWKETIRMQLIGAMFRRNSSGRSLKFEGFTIPNDAFVIHHINNADFDGAVYDDPDCFDPSRFVPDSDGVVESQKRYAFMGFGAAVHPCAGARLARLQSVISTSMLLAMFDIDVLDDTGKVLHEPPLPDRNNHKTSIPKGTYHLGFRMRIPSKEVSQSQSQSHLRNQ